MLAGAAEEGWLIWVEKRTEQAGRQTYTWERRIKKTGRQVKTCNQLEQVEKVALRHHHVILTLNYKLIYVQTRKL